MNDLELAISAARAGGAIVAAGFGTIAAADFKRRNDPVTEVDRTAEQAIVELITAHRPDDALLGEEGAASGDHSGRTWLIDPLDGTVNFVHALPIVSVSIGLFDGDRPLVGVVYDPINEELYAAESGRGATLNGSSISVSEVDDPTQALVVTGFPYDHHEHATAYVAAVRDMLTEVNGIRRLGSAALDQCYIAAGRIDAGWEYDLRPWDIAAGLVILLEAGGRSTHPDGRPTTPWTQHTVTSNGHIHETIRRIVDGAFPTHLR